MTTIMTVLIRTMGVTRRVIHMAKILKSCAGVTQVTFQLGLAYCRTVPIGRGQPVTGSARPGSGRTHCLPDPGTVALNQSERAYSLCSAMSVSPGRPPGLFQTDRSGLGEQGPC